MDIWKILEIISTVIAIVSFIMALKFKKLWWLWCIIAILFISLGIFAYNSERKLQQINDIHRQAVEISSHYNPYSINQKAFIQEVLVFLQKNNYEVEYQRAMVIYDEMKGQMIQYDDQAAAELYGIINGIAAMTKE